MTEIYYGRSMENAFQAVAHDLGGMQVAVRLALGQKDIAPRKAYLRRLADHERSFADLADHPDASKKWWKETVRRTNDLLYEIHLMTQLPLWQYVVVEWPHINLVTARRVPERTE